MQTDDGNAILVASASKTFANGTLALKQVSFQVKAGERVALIGASGSGKSTLLRCLSGLELLDEHSGAIKVFGHDLQIGSHFSENIRTLRRDTAIVFQQFNLVGRLCVLENVLVGAAAELSLIRNLILPHRPEFRARGLDALRHVGLESQAYQRAATLSGGQQQRVAVARALMQGARVLLADEPVASLDPQSSRVVMDTLLKLNTEHGVTLVVSLHDVDTALHYCERVIALKQGEVIFDGPKRDLSPKFLGLLYGSHFGSDTDRGQVMSLDHARKLR